MISCGRPISLVTTYIAAALAFLSLVGCDPLCANHVLKEIPSPDKKYRAFLFRRDCGATTSFNTQVSVLLSSQSLVDGGNVFIIDFKKSVSTPSEVQVGWPRNGTLWIRYVGHEVRIFRQEHKLGEVSVVYDAR
jgi:hypothetical protein